MAMAEFTLNDGEWHQATPGGQRGVMQIISGVVRVADIDEKPTDATPTLSLTGIINFDSENVLWIKSNAAYVVTAYREA